jgi:TonB family protein
MVRSGFSLLLMVAGLLGLLPTSSVDVPSVQAGSGPAGSSVAGKRWVRFDLANLDASGEVQLNQPVQLSIAVGGVAQGHAPLVAICESALFARQVVMMDPDPESMALKATATLQPIPHGKLSVIPKVARVQVTFARSQNDKLERVMTRIVYVTLGDPVRDGDPGDARTPEREDAVPAEAGPEDEIQPDVEPMASGRMVEEDLVPLPTPGQGRAYWQQVSVLVSRSWSRTARRVRHSPSSETVRVRFRLYPSGRAQLIEIEKGSGAREIDEAGIFAVVHAQPFPPFPEDVGTDPVDVHVRMRTGPKMGSQDARSVGNSQPVNPHQGTVTPKK